MDLIDKNIDNVISTDSAKTCDDSLKENAEFAEKAGLEVHVVRKYDGVGLSNNRQCEYCLDRCGDYKSYEDAYQSEAFQRHPGCGCTIEYTSAKGEKTVQNRAGGRDSWLSEEDARQDRIRRANDREMAARAARKARKNVVNGEKSDIIKIGNADDYIGKKIIKTDNQSIREWYVANVSNIPNLIDVTKSKEEQAKQAFKLRNKFKREARVAMSDEDTVKELERVRPMPTWEELVNSKMRRKNMTREEAIMDILNTASKTNDDVNIEFGL